MTERSSTSPGTLALAGSIIAGALLSCLIPDRDIVVYSTDPCGELWSVHTSGAYGYNGLGEDAPIVDEDEHPIAKTYCLNPNRADDMNDPTSALHFELVSDIIQTCQDRAIEMGLLDADDTCTTMADAAFVEPCQESHTDCDEDETGTGAETGADEGTGSSPDTGGLEALDLDLEVVFDGVEYGVSQRLIDVAMADTLGLIADGTRAALVEDADGLAYGFEISGVEPGNLGDALGLRNRDVITEIAGRPTASYEDLFELSELLASASRVEVRIERGEASVTLRYRRVGTDAE